ncbi:peptidylprolyl isomerase [Altibacter lentus]|uniref:peptidylprolyl isomerase n=1 Tax=Altibacter lentus TaxID=1223410 RepID=UPI000550465B|nr:peptidylprolyl isomerase [Altibacter lentus]
MAVLNSIRKRGVFLIVIIALALFSFVLADVIRNGGLGTEKGQTTVATVNGEDISRQEFMEQVENTQRGLGPNAGANQAMNIVWDRELRRLLLQQQYEEIGLTAETELTNASLAKFLATNPTFQNEAGQFSQAKLQEYIADVRANNPVAYEQWLEYVENTKVAALETTYLNMVKSGLIATLAEGENQYRFENDKVNIQFVQVPYSSIADEDVPVSESEIAAYIKKHPKEYEVEAMADIQYVTYTEEPSKEDLDAAKADIMALLEDSVEYNTVTKANDTILGFRKTTNNEEFVNASSDVNFEDTYWFKNELPEVIRDTVFAMNVGDIFGPYEIENSLNLTKVIGMRQLPDTVSARHILIPTGMNPTDSIARTDEQAKATADSLLRVVRADRSKFVDLVTQYSSDSGSIAKGGKYENFTYGAMVPEFRDFTFENNTGDMGVVKTQFGYHVIEIENQKNTQKAVKLATISREIEPSEKTINDIFSKATTFELDAQKGDFAEVAAADNKTVKPVNKIGELDANIPGLGSNRSIVTWAFDEETNVGDVKRFNVPEGYVIAQLTRKNEKGLMSVAEASAKVTPILRKQKKADKIRASITGTTLQDIASSQNVTVKNATAVTMANPTIADAGTEPKVVGAAFGTKAGETTKLIDGETGVFKVKVLALNKAPELDNYASFANQLNAKEVPAINSKVYNALKSAAEIEDYRATFY